MELMDGEIGVESEPGVGSEFWFELNRDIVPVVDDGHTLQAEPTLKKLGEAEMYSLLYVEDNPANLLLVEQIIADYANMSMLSAHEGILGVDLARTHQPDVILMDINLPGISGFEALAILRSDPLTANIPVLAISANAMPHDIKLGKEAGFLDYLTKPIRVNKFIEALALALEHSAAKSKDGRN